MKIIRNIAVITVVLAVLASCKVLTSKGDQPTFEGTHWKLIALNQKAVESTEQKTIDFKEAKANGRAACNSFSADYELKRSKVSFSNIVSTKMFCDGLMDQESQILTDLQKVNRFEIRYGLLYLYESNTLLLTYKK